MFGYRDKLNNSVVLHNRYGQLKRLVERPREIDSFWPSEATVDVLQNDGTWATQGGCQRKIFYSLHGTHQGDINYISLKRMKLGNLVEENEIEHSRIVSDDVRGGAKVRIREGLIQISGKIDHILKDMVTGKYDIMEHKSSYGHFFAKQVFKNREFKVPHAIQLGLYMYAIRVRDILNSEDITYEVPGKETPISNKDVRYGKLVYTDRGNCDNADFPIDISPVAPVNMENPNAIRGTNVEPYICTLNQQQKVEKIVSIQGIFDKLHSIYIAAKNGQLPPRDFIASCDTETLDEMLERNKITKAKRYELMKKEKIDWQCSYCPYHQMCIANEMPKTQEENIQIAKEKMEEIEITFRDMYNYDIKATFENTKDEETNEDSDSE